jgi:hypothetical protein
VAKTISLSKWFIFWWVGATLVGLLAAFVILLPLLLTVDRVGGADASLYLGLAAAFAAAGALIGAAQWLIALRRNSAVRANWIGASAAGLALAALVIAILDSALQFISQELAVAVLVPLAVGGAQSWALRGKVARPGMWIAISYLAFLAFFGFLVYGGRSSIASAGLYLSYPLITAVGMWWLLGTSAAGAKPKRPATKVPQPKKKKR